MGKIDDIIKAIENPPSHYWEVQDKLDYSTASIETLIAVVRKLQQVIANTPGITGLLIKDDYVIANGDQRLRYDDEWVLEKVSLDYHEWDEYEGNVYVKIDKEIYRGDNLTFALELMRRR